jgi:preprotein translocase subunit SecG
MESWADLSTHILTRKRLEIYKRACILLRNVLIYQNAGDICVCSKTAPLCRTGNLWHQRENSERVDLIQMVTIKLILTIIQLISSVSLIIIVSFQSGKDAGLGAALSGSSSTENFYSKNKSSTMSAKLAKVTKWVAFGFIILTLVLNLIG